MTLTLSSEVLPSAPIDVLRRGARRKNLEGLECTVRSGGQDTATSTGVPFGNRSAIDWDPADGASTLPGAGTAGLDEGDPPIEWLLLGEDASITELLYWSRQAHLIGAGLLLRNTAVESPLCVPLALLHPTDRAAAHRAATWARLHDARTAWEIRLGRTAGDSFEEVLDVTAPTLAHVRLVGAGPEAGSGESEELGVGTVLKELTLRGFSGTVALTRSAQGSRQAWRKWFFEERGWGCNTAARKKETP